MKYWKCDICGRKYRETANYHENLGKTDSLRGIMICIKCVNETSELKELGNAILKTFGLEEHQNNGE